MGKKTELEKYLEFSPTSKKSLQGSVLLGGNTNQKTSFTNPASELADLSRYTPLTERTPAQGSMLLEKYGGTSPASSVPGKNTTGGGTGSPTGTTPTAPSFAAPESGSSAAGQKAPTYETDFLKWYRDNYGADYQGGGLTQGALSDGDFDVGQTLYKYYLQDQTAAEQRNAALRDMAAERSAAEQSASITYDKLQKYLPQQLRAQGLGNLGVSDSAMLEAGNQYLATMAGLAGDFGKRELTLEEAYGQSQRERELAKAEEVKGVLDAYRTKAETEEQKTQEEEKAAQDAEFVNLETIISGGYYNDPAELRAYLDANKGGLSDTQYKLLDQMVTYLENSPEEAARLEALEEQAAAEEASGLKTLDQATVKNKADAEEVYGNITLGLANPVIGGIIATINDSKNNDNFKKGDNFNVNIGDLTYKVQSGGEATDANVLLAAKSVENNTVFGYDEKLYLKRSGKVYIVEARDLTKKDHYDKLWAQFYS